MKINKTNAARILESGSIKYELITYEVDESDLSAVHVAAQLGEPVEQVFKTLVLSGNKTGYLVCIIPAEKEVDLKKASRISGNKNCSLIPMKDLLPVTGYIRGACSPVGMKKLLPTYIDSSCLQFENIYVSAGVRGLQLKVAPSGIIKMTKAVTGELCL